MLHSRHLRGSGGFRVLFYLPYVIPFVAGVLIWRDMLNIDSGWVDGLLRILGVQHPAGLAAGPDLDLLRPGVDGRLGHRRRDHRLPGRAERASRPSCTTRP